jgi:hypothetical protein
MRCVAIIVLCFGFGGFFWLGFSWLVGGIIALGETDGRFFSSPAGGAASFLVTAAVEASSQQVEAISLK